MKTNRVVYTLAATLFLCASLYAASLPLQTIAVVEGSREASATRAGQGADERARALPEGPGSSLVTMQCVGCHNLAMALSKRGTANEWRATVQAMLDRGARITSQDADAIASYLAQHYGPDAPVATSTERSGPVSGVTGWSRERRPVMKKCYQCHPGSLWSTLRLDRRGWEGVIYRMIGRGAFWTEDESRAMADYLARVRGPR